MAMDMIASKLHYSFLPTMDNVFEYLNNLGINDENNLIKIDSFLRNQEYDSDVLMYDMEDVENCIWKKYINNDNKSLYELQNESELLDMKSSIARHIKNLHSNLLLIDNKYEEIIDNALSKIKESIMSRYERLKRNRNVKLLRDLNESYKMCQNATKQIQCAFETLNQSKERLNIIEKQVENIRKNMKKMEQRMSSSKIDAEIISKFLNEINVIREVEMRKNPKLYSSFIREKEKKYHLEMRKKKEILLINMEIEFNKIILTSSSTTIRSISILIKRKFREYLMALCVNGK